jgi:hypothetical protein
MLVSKRNQELAVRVHHRRTEPAVRVSMNRLSMFVVWAVPPVNHAGADCKYDNGTDCKVIQYRMQFDTTLQEGNTLLEPPEQR